MATTNDASPAGPRRRYAVGIDLGTTHTVVACAPLDGAPSPVRVFAVPQLVAPREVAEQPLLPSVLYARLEGEPAEDPFDDGPWVLGELARKRAVEVPGRTVASAKSWLAHADVDRTAAILPWGGVEGAPRMSPVEAAARLLAHVRSAWDARHPEAPLAEQEVVLTVPASFDEVARELTVQAASAAGLAPKLLEEPQAAFYDWMAGTRGERLAQTLEATGGEALVLVVDVGGGTTDFSLMRVSGADRVDRLAVGPHLLLGGDNMDLALAHACEGRLSDGQPLDAARFAQLVASCRSAKEALLGGSGLAEAPVTVVGAGAQLVGATRTTRLSREEVERTVLDGFLPAVAADSKPQRARSGFVAVGLPYERDAAITRHLAAFLERHRSLTGALPNAVLLNGGVFRSTRIADRVMETLAAWRDGDPPRRLADTDPDVAVARGAVAYALARLGRGVRIGGGTGRGYFIGISAQGEAPRAVCVVPRGAEEGSVHAARGRTFAISVDRAVRFELFASDSVQAGAGDVVGLDEDRYRRLPPLVSSMGAPSLRRSESAEVLVSIEGELTPVGTLDLACVEVGAAQPRRFRLAFQLREPSTAPGPAVARQSARPPATAAPRLRAAVDQVDLAYGKARDDATGREAKDLLRNLERELGERPTWTTETNRALFDALVENGRTRRRSPEHERTFWLLAGWCVRPGFGDPGDARRVAALATLFDDRLAFPAEARGWQQFFIALRRAAGGMDEKTQTRVRAFVDPYLAPSDPSRKRPKKPALSLDDALEMASSLERVAAPRRIELGGWVIERTWTDRDPRLWSALGRIGARVPAYASVHHVIAPHAAERWLDHMLREKWETVPAAAQAAMRLARRTGDRSRDVAEGVRREVERRLVAARVEESWIRAVREVVPVDEKERAAFFGDVLPLGLRLVE